MSSANSSAKQRRAGVTTNDPSKSTSNISSNIPPANGLTLPQVISLVDTRLTKLESSFKAFESSENPINSEYLTPILDEFNSRFMLLAEEMASLKDTLMKLQTYTMDVNTLLLEKLQHNLSETPNTI
jgi:hypothetical protein